MNLGVYKNLCDRPESANDNDICFCEETKSAYIMVDAKWMPYDATLNLGITEYEVNKMVISQLASLVSDEQLKAPKSLINEYIRKDNKGCKYFMLLCNDIHYYTVFHIENLPLASIEDQVIACLQQRGEIKLFNRTEDNQAIECWIDTKDDGVLMFMLFDYNWGIVECR